MSLPKDPVIDEDIFQQVLLIPQFSNGIDTKEQKQKILSNKNNELFTVCYNMMLHTKLKNLNLSVCAFKTVFKVPKTRINQVLLALRVLKLLVFNGLKEDPLLVNENIAYILIPALIVL